MKYIAQVARPNASNFSVLYRRPFFLKILALYNAELFTCVRKLTLAHVGALSGLYRRHFFLKILALYNAELFTCVRNMT